VTRIIAMPDIGKGAKRMFGLISKNIFLSSFFVIFKGRYVPDRALSGLRALAYPFNIFSLSPQTQFYTNLAKCNLD
jgi:hypothetical protein